MSQVPGVSPKLTSHPVTVNLSTSHKGDGPLGLAETACSRSYRVRPEDLSSVSTVGGCNRETCVDISKELVSHRRHLYHGSVGGPFVRWGRVVIRHG